MLSSEKLQIEVYIILIF